MSLPRFVLLDNSLIEVGGHFLEHALRVLEAAETAGFQPVLASNRKFTQREVIPDNWMVYPVFRYTALGPYSSFSALPESSTDIHANSGLAYSLKQFLGRRKRVRSFALSCDKLFQEITLDRDDHVFLPFCTELSLLGVLKYLHRCPCATNATWHLYYHSSCLLGRPSDWPVQEHRTRVMKQALCQAEELAERNRLRFYATTEHVCDSLNRLSRISFRYLPFPVEADGQSSFTDLSCEPPLRLLLAGQPRAEKGVTYRADFVTSLWGRGLSNGELQLRMQQQPGTPALQVPSDIQRGLLRSDPAPVVFAPYPLSAEGYREFLQCADVGLLMYDSESYYSRISSVMLELLCSGVPVIVPAGCWMGELVAEANAQYLEKASRFWKPLVDEGTPPVDGLQQRCYGDGVQRRHFKTGAALVPEDASVWFPKFHWDRPGSRGAYLRLDVMQTDHRGETVKRWAMVIHRATGMSVSSALFALHAAARTIHWSICDAYTDAELPQGQLNSRFFAGPAAVPCGSIGLSAVDRWQVPELVTEMATHYQHYRQAASVYGAALAQRHTATVHVSQLLYSDTGITARHCA